MKGRQRGARGSTDDQQLKPPERKYRMEAVWCPSRALIHMSGAWSWSFPPPFAPHGLHVSSNPSIHSPLTIDTKQIQVNMYTHVYYLCNPSWVLLYLEILEGEYRSAAVGWDPGDWGYPSFIPWSVPASHSPSGPVLNLHLQDLVYLAQTNR